MRAFTVPFQFPREEKIFGGKMSARQVIYALGGGFLAAAFIFFPRFPLFLRIPLGAAALSAGLALAFFQLYEMNFDNFAVTLLRYMRRPKRLYLKGDE